MFCTLYQYYSSDQTKKNEMGKACNTYGGEQRCIQGFRGEPEGRRPLGSPRRRWEDNIKMDFREVGWGGIDCIDLAQYRDRWRTVVNTVMNLQIT
jgi:hypothetical protein